MKGYSKIKGNHSFIPRSNSKKEFLFLDKDFDVFSSKSINKKPHLHEHEQTKIGEKDHGGDTKNNELYIGKTEENDGGGDHHHHHSLKNEGGERNGGVLWRNLSVSSTSTPSYQKNNINNGGLERQSSTRSIQGAVKRAFSIKRSSSVNYDRYCRIYDQPLDVDDCDYVFNNNNDDDDFGRNNNGSLETTRSVSMMKKNKNHNGGRKHVGSKVVRACKRLFSL